ncbi:MAG: hypothetical protein AAGB02_09160 [Pseudomonadota bacterium]
MIDFDYAGQHVRGVWRLAFGGGDPHSDLDNSHSGVFRSLAAIILSAPFTLLAVTSARRAALMSPDIRSSALSEAPIAVFLTAKTTVFLLDWAIGLAALIFTARLLGATEKAAGAIVSYNWAQLIIAIVVAGPLVILGMTADANIFSLFYFPALAFSIVLLWRVLRASLPLDVGMAIALIAVLLLIGVVANASVSYVALGLLQLFS